MDKLDSLFVLPVLFQYGLIKKRTIQLTPVVLSDFYLFEQLSKSVLDIIACSDKKVFKKYRHYIDHFNAIGSGLPIAKIKKISLKNSLALVNKIYDVNMALFQTADIKTDKQSPQEPYNWFDIVQKLISNGHRWSEIQQYNYAQIMGFIEVIENQNKDDSRSDLILMRAAQSDEKGFNSVMKSLTTTKNGKTEKQSPPHKPKKRK